MSTRETIQCCLHLGMRRIYPWRRWWLCLRRQRSRGTLVPPGWSLPFLL